ncbi:MAG: oxidoreductase [Candidatus Binatia bacterium]
MPETVTDSVWLITGCSTGLGRAIAVAALDNGYRVVVTARDPDRVKDLAATYPAHALALPLDVTDASQVTATVAEAERVFGRIDVLVNNAGYGYLAAIEEGEESDVQAMFDTNFFGVMRMVKAVLPGMRKRGRGHIVNISSMTGLVANPAAGYYASSKFALEALTEALSKEVHPLGIRVTAIEPGAFRTDWSGRSMKESRLAIAAYANTAGARRVLIRAADGRQAGDPARAAAAVLMVVESAQPPLHLLLGRDIYEAFQAKLAGWRDTLAEWESVTLGTDFPQG